MFQKMQSRMLVSPALMGLIAATGVIFGSAWYFSQSSGGQPAASSQATLSNMSDDMASYVDAWLESQWAELSAIADNPATQIYFTVMGEAQDASELPQTAYLQTALENAAEKLGFVDAQGGLILLNKLGEKMVASKAAPALQTADLAAIKQTSFDKKTLISLTDTSMIGFVVPVFSVQSEPSQNTQAGYLVGVINPSQMLAKLNKPYLYAQPSLRVELAQSRSPLNAEDGSEIRALNTTPWMLVSTAKPSLVSHVRYDVLWMTLLALAGTLAAYLSARHDTKEQASARKQIQSMDTLVATLISLVDGRDPNASEHSKNVAFVAEKLADEMKLSALMRNTTITAARLMNIGKLAVPAELLTRSGELNPQEMLSIRNGMAASADLLEGIDFEGPVSQTLHETQEHADGTGPLQLAGENILISARIVAAANALVAMISPRSYRAAMGIEQALDVMQQDAGKRYDAEVISMLQKLHHRGALQGLSSSSASGGMRSKIEQLRKMR